MSQLFYGSICLSDLIEQAKKPHSAFSKAKNGKIYGNVKIWLNDEPDQYGNMISVQLSSKEEASESEGKIYIGNAKKSEKKEPEALTAETLADLPDDSDLPF